MTARNIGEIVTGAIADRLDQVAADPRAMDLLIDFQLGESEGLPNDLVDKIKADFTPLPTDSNDVKKEKRKRNAQAWWRVNKILSGKESFPFGSSDELEDADPNNPTEVAARQDKIEQISWITAGFREMGRQRLHQLGLGTRAVSRETLLANPYEAATESSEPGKMSGRDLYSPSALRQMGTSHYKDSLDMLGVDFGKMSPEQAQIAIHEGIVWWLREPEAELWQVAGKVIARAGQRVSTNTSMLREGMVAAKSIREAMRFTLDAKVLSAVQGRMLSGPQAEALVESFGNTVKVRLKDGTERAVRVGAGEIWDKFSGNDVKVGFVGAENLSKELREKLVELYGPELEKLAGHPIRTSEIAFTSKTGKTIKPGEPLIGEGVTDIKAYENDYSQKLYILRDLTPKDGKIPRLNANESRYTMHAWEQVDDDFPWFKEMLLDEGIDPSDVVGIYPSSQLLNLGDDADDYGLVVTDPETKMPYKIPYGLATDLGVLNSSNEMFKHVDESKLGNDLVVNFTISGDTFKQVADGLDHASMVVVRSDPGLKADAVSESIIKGMVPEAYLSKYAILAVHFRMLALSMYSHAPGRKVELFDFMKALNLGKKADDGHKVSDVDRKVVEYSYPGVVRDQEAKLGLIRGVFKENDLESSQLREALLLYSWFAFRRFPGDLTDSLWANYIVKNATESESTLTEKTLQNQVEGFMFHALGEIINGVFAPRIDVRSAQEVTQITQNATPRIKQVMTGVNFKEYLEGVNKRYKKIPEREKRDYRGWQLLGTEFSWKRYDWGAQAKVFLKQFKYLEASGESFAAILQLAESSIQAIDDKVLKLAGAKESIKDLEDQAYQGISSLIEAIPFFKNIQTSEAARGYVRSLTESIVGVQNTYSYLTGVDTRRQMQALVTSVTGILSPAMQIAAYEINATKRGMIATDEGPGPGVETNLLSLATGKKTEGIDEKTVMAARLARSLGLRVHVADNGEATVLGGDGRIIEKLKGVFNKDFDSGHMEWTTDGVVDKSNPLVKLFGHHKIAVAFQAFVVRKVLTQALRDTGKFTLDDEKGVMKNTVLAELDREILRRLNKSGFTKGELKEIYVEGGWGSAEDADVVLSDN